MFVVHALLAFAVRCAAALVRFESDAVDRVVAFPAHLPRLPLLSLLRSAHFLNVRLLRRSRRPRPLIHGGAAPA